MHRKNVSKDSTLERLVNETAEELGIKVDTVWRVFNHFYYYIYKMLTETQLKYFTRDKKREEAVNISIPGLGRILNRYGKTYKDKGAVENQHKQSGYDNRKETRSKKESS